MAKRKVSAIERELIDDMTGLVGHLRSGAPLDERYTVRQVVLDLEPGEYAAADVKQVRHLLNFSQQLFAQFLGVSVKTVQSWELGKTPSGTAARFMDEIRRNPKYWQSRLRESTHPRGSQDAPKPKRKRPASRAG